MPASTLTSFHAEHLPEYIICFFYIFVFAYGVLSTLEAGKEGGGGAQLGKKWYRAFPGNQVYDKTVGAVALQSVQSFCRPVSLKSHCTTRNPF
jgi:hypothetical protein